eukprot:TRINITY_DN1245_c0_g1_i6.p1 TRINITY_DN1245_c0_g1~~TRINITY_DN1245_c0_g1_i6.p1  ORF type:complete len:253 (+),score=33.22 TRINITY_DN1245_c0_g1_i6:585-1343(+)
MYTDDSFQFNNVVKEMTRVFETLYQKYIDRMEDPDVIVKDRPTEENSSIKLGSHSKTDDKNTRDQDDIEPQLRNQFPRRYDFELSDEIKTLMGNQEALEKLTKDVLFSSIKDLCDFYKAIWAKSTINIFYNNIYTKKEIFDEEQTKILDDIMNSLKNGKGRDLNKDFKRSEIDRAILSNPLNSRNEVKDGRDVSYSMDGANSWASRQCGLQKIYCKAHMRYSGQSEKGITKSLYDDFAVRCVYLLICVMSID